MKIILILQMSLIFLSNIYAQSASDWRNHTDKSNTADITVSGGYLWAATSGGGFGWNLTDSSFMTLTKTNGLQSINLTAVTSDNKGKIWFGSSNGIISVFDPSNNSVKSILDIYISDKVNKSINELNTSGDTIIASTDFGISLIDANSYVFLDTYFRFGDFTSFIKVNSTFRNNLYYVATNSGAAIQKQNTTNLTAPESWNVYRKADGLPDDIVMGITSYKDTVFCATQKGLAVFNGVSWLQFLPEFTTAVTDIYTVDPGTGEEVLYFINNNTIYQYSNGNVTEFFSGPYVKNSIKYFEGTGFFVATSGGAASLNNFNGSNFVKPNGPVSNQFRDLSVGSDHILWAATGASGVGANSLQDDMWINYNAAVYPGMITDGIYSVLAAPDNIKYFGTWGSGVTIYDNQEFINYNSSNSGLVGIIENPSYIVITALEKDSRNNLWVLNYGSANVNSLSMLSTENEWHHFKVPAENNLYSFGHLDMVIDNYDTKWYFINSSNRKALFYFNENKTYTDPNDDVSAAITTDQGLTSNTITTLAVDRRGDVWVGTDQGLTIITNTGSVLSTSQLRYFPVYLLRQQTINCIAVDPLNNKWVGTNQGLLYVNSDGSGLIAAYDSKNSPLLADEIRSLTVDPNTGVVYAGTDAGLISFKTFAVNPADVFDELKIFPNPFILSKGNQNVTIDGLIRDTDIKILTISGKLVYEFSSPGGRVAYWNGRDFNGNIVNSGVYIIAAFDKEGNNVTTAKVAIVRE